MSKEYTDEIIENTRRQMQEIGYDNVKNQMINSVCLTQSFFTLEDLKAIMPEEEYQELFKKIEIKARKTYSQDKYPNVSQEEIESAIQEEIEGFCFTIVNDNNSGFVIKDFFSRDNTVAKISNINLIDGAILANIISRVMQKHLDYGIFHANKYYSAEELKIALINGIDKMKRQREVFEQDRNSETIDETFKKDNEPKTLEEEMLYNVSLTQSWFTLENLKEFISEEEYEELLNSIVTKHKEIYNSKNYPNDSQEELEQLIRAKVSATIFLINNTDNGEYILEEFSRYKPINKTINLETINKTLLLTVIAKIMQKHLDYGKFYDDENITAEEIENILRTSIDKIKKVFEQDREKDDVSDSIVNMEETTSEIESDSANNQNLLESAIEATEISTKTSTIERLSQGIKNIFQGIKNIVQSLSKEKDEK